MAVADAKTRMPVSVTPRVEGRAPGRSPGCGLPGTEGPRSGDAGTLIDARFDHDSCGVGFVASVEGKASHKILQDALTALARLEHRGAVAPDGASSDGIGVMAGIPRALLLAETGIQMGADELLGVGMVFLPQEESDAEAVIESCLRSQQLRVLGWRDVPTLPEILGEIALSTMPRIRQVLVADAATPDADAMERRMYLARKQFERAIEAGETAGYICSFSATTIVYKAMCLGRLLPNFYPDLASLEYVTNFAVFHQRYATNTLPAWHRAQPGRYLGHNGEINTVWGNRSRMAARDSSLPVECKPVLTRDGTDSTSLDETVELLAQNGRTIAEAVRMLMPPAIVDRVSPFLRYHAGCTEPWDGPAAIAFSDGNVVGAALDRNGLRPCRYAITSDGLMVAGSEAGLVDLDPETLIESGRLGPGQMIAVDMAEGKIYHNEEMLDAFDAKATYATLVEHTPLEPIAVTEDVGDLAAQQRGFGYTKEDVKMILQPMAATGKDASVVDGRRHAAGVPRARAAPAVLVFSTAVCAGNEPGDRSAAGSDCRFVGDEVWAVGAHSGEASAAAGHFVEFAVSFARTDGGAAGAAVSACRCVAVGGVDVSLCAGANPGAGD